MDVQASFRKGLEATGASELLGFQNPLQGVMVVGGRAFAYFALAQTSVYV